MLQEKSQELFLSNDLLSWRFVILIIGRQKMLHTVAAEKLSTRLTSERNKGKIYY